MRRKVITRSKYRLTSCDMGQLIPIGLWESLAGEMVQHRTSMLIRVSPLASPIYHPVVARVHHFFMPSRLLWPQETGGTPGDNWEEFITGGESGTNSATPPTLMTTGAEKDLWDYLLVERKAGVECNALPIYMYNAVWNEWFRDEDLETKREKSDVSIANIAWEKDYYTSARPFQQKGPDVTIPVGGLTPVQGIGVTGATTNPNVSGVREADGSTKTYANAWAMPQDGLFEENPDLPGFPNVFVDLAAAVGADVTDFRKALALQRYQENRARWGSRYVEYLWKSFRATPQDARLQRPELLGGGRSPLNFSEVLQTAPDASGSERFGVGDLFGHGIGSFRANKYRRVIPEHGYIMSLLSVRPKAMYMNGAERHWFKKDKFDYFQPEMKHIGQQEVWKNEVFLDAATGLETFGYQDRYSEYRHSKSGVTGEFRDLLNYWHMGRQFDSMPTLNGDFVRCVPTKRIHNEQTQNALWVMVQHNKKVLSPIGVNASPRIL